MSNEEYFGKCIFKTEDIIPLVKHALECKEHRNAYGPGDPGPGLVWVHDWGVYLCSNGLPILQDSHKDKPSSISVYAAGMGPDNDSRWADQNVGYDDFAEFIAIEEFPPDMLDKYRYFVIDVAEHTMRLRYSSERWKGLLSKSGGNCV